MERNMHTPSSRFGFSSATKTPSSTSVATPSTANSAKVKPANLIPRFQANSRTNTPSSAAATPTNFTGRNLYGNTPTARPAMTKTLPGSSFKTPTTSSATPKFGSARIQSTYVTQRPVTKTPSTTARAPLTTQSAKPLNKRLSNSTKSVRRSIKLLNSVNSNRAIATKTPTSRLPVKKYL